MTVYRHLSHALRIMRQQPDFTKWGPLIDELTPEQQAEVRPWLRDRARIAQYRQRATKATATSDLPKAYSSPTRSWNGRRAGRTGSSGK